jgi:hypothetical protein
VGGGQAVHDQWTYVHVAATKLQLHPGAVRQGATNVYELRPQVYITSLHNKKLHKNVKKCYKFLSILRIDFFENL